MTLTLIERAILRNQLELLGEGDKYLREYTMFLISILEGGFEGDYEHVFNRFRTPLSEVECSFVKKVLSMFRELTAALESGIAVSADDRESLTFLGFSKHTESRLAHYASFWLNNDYSDLGNQSPREHKSAECEFRMSERYQRMYVAWGRIPNPYQVTNASDLRSIAASSKES